MAPAFTFLATTATGTESALAKELRSLGLQRVVEGKQWVRFRGPLRDGYRACLWSRVASRVLLELHKFEGTDSDALYDGLRTIHWADHIHPRGTVWIDFSGGSKHIRDSRFGAQRSKDAICDTLVERFGQRPSVEAKQPDVRVRVHMREGLVTTAIDLAGQALHLRSAARNTGHAPLRETLAAAVLWELDWPKRARKGQPLHDPMCGSGSFLLESAAMALDLAPGLSRHRWGFSCWQGHDKTSWGQLIGEAKERFAQGRKNAFNLRGADVDGHVIAQARENARAAGLEHTITFEKQSLEAARPKASMPGLMVTNPPYGKRLADPEQATVVHRMLGDVLRHQFLGWDAGVLTETELVGHIGLKTTRRIPLVNGPIDCRLAQFSISSTAPTGKGPGWRNRQ